MDNFTITVDSGFKKKLANYPEINWSEVARQAWAEKIRQLDLLNRLTAKSRASEKDIIRIAASMRKGIAKKHEK